MTRKDYKILADALKAAKPAQPISGPLGDAVWRITVEKVTNDLQTNYPNFNRTKFLEATDYWGREDQG